MLQGVDGIRVGSGSGVGVGVGSPADSTRGTVTPHRGPEQPPTLYAGPFEAHVVARVLSARTALVPLADGRVVLAAGLFRYALGGDGTAALLGDLPSYAARIPPDDSQLGGYDVPPLVPDDVVPGALPWLDLRVPRDGRHRPEGGALSDDLDVPAGVHGDDLRRAADGTSVLLARESPGEAYVTFVAPAQSRHATRLPIDVLEPARRDVTCEHVPS